MRVARLDGPLLDFWVAKSENLQLQPNNSENGETQLTETGFWHPDTYHPSRNWAHGGSIVSNEWYEIEGALLEWFGPGWPFIKAIIDEPLKWFMRAYVKTKFGEEVEEIQCISSEMENKPGITAPKTASPWMAWLGNA